MIIFGLIIFILILFFFVSYFWTHFGILILLAPTKPWVMELVKYKTFGDQHKLSILIFFIVAILLLTLIQIYFLNSKFLEKFSIKKLLIISLITSLIASLSYTFLSSDIFSYLFAGKMVTFFHLNPYLNAPIVVEGKELWFSFTLWVNNVNYTIFGTDIKYAYGPIFLAYSLIPFLIFTSARFLGVFYGLKLLNVATFMICGWMLLKINKNDKKVFAYWFFNPLLILELLINSHNDLIMIALFVTSIFFSVVSKNKVFQITAFIASVATKFLSGLLIFSLVISGKIRLWLFRLAGFGLLFYNAYNPKHMWYYTWIYMIFPFINLKKRSWTIIFLFQSLLLILQYSKFIIHNQWGLLDWMPSQQYFRWGLPILLIISEINIFSILKKRKYFLIYLSIFLIIFSVIIRLKTSIHPSLTPEKVIPTITPIPTKYTAKVARVIDGDTIKLDTGEVVRYIGMDAPETVDPKRPVGCYGKEASAKNKELVEGKEIQLEKDVSETDKYGRLLRYIWLEDTLINEYLVRQGYAHIDTYPPDVKYQAKFLEAEKLARNENKGLWGDVCKK